MSVRPPSPYRRASNSPLGHVALWGTLVGIPLMDPLRVWHDGSATWSGIAFVAGMVAIAVGAYAVFTRPMLKVEPGLLTVRNVLRQWSIPPSEVTALRIGRFTAEVVTAERVIEVHALEMRARTQTKKRAEVEGHLAEDLALAKSAPDQVAALTESRARPALLQWIHAGVLAGYLLLGILVR